MAPLQQRELKIALVGTPHDLRQPSSLRRPLRKLMVKKPFTSV